MNSYELSRNWFDWCFDNPEKIKPVHTAIYFFSIEHCNRLGWMPKFGLPTEMVKSAIGIHSYNTYIDALNDLVEWGFIKMIQKSKNQYSSNIIALSNFDKATTKALDKAMIKHSTKQGESIDSINKQINKEQENKETSDFDLAFESFIEMRTKGKNTITDRAIELIKMKLNKLAPEDEAKKILILNQSVMNNWKDVYDLKKESKTDSEPHWKSFAR
jgi:hypothetical protein